MIWRMTDEKFELPPMTEEQRKAHEIYMKALERKNRRDEEMIRNRRLK